MSSGGVGSMSIHYALGKLGALKGGGQELDIEKKKKKKKKKDHRICETQASCIHEQISPLLVLDLLWAL